MVGGWGEVGPTDSELGQTLRAASVCPRDFPGIAEPKNELPNYPVPNPIQSKPKKQVVPPFSLGLKLIELVS